MPSAFSLPECAWPDASCSPYLWRAGCKPKVILAFSTASCWTKVIQDHPYSIPSTLSPSSGPVVETDIDTKLQAWLTVIRSSGTFFSQAAPQSVCAHNQLLLNSGLSGLFPSILHSVLVEAFTSYEAKTMTILQRSTGSGSSSKNSWITGSFLLEYI